MKIRRKKVQVGKSQSAIEYLMTIIWVFLLIGIVALILYQFGAFTPITQPKAHAGACQVSRPEGPHTTTLVSFEGVCTNQLPYYVGYLSQQGGGNIKIPLNKGLNTNKLTLTFWAHITGNENFPQDIIFISNTFYICQQGNNGNTETPWQFIALTINTTKPTNNANLYVNDTLIETTTYGGPSSSNELDIGGAIPGSFNCPPVNNAPLYGMNGYVSNFQIYSSVFNLNELNQLYTEGLGGDPTNLYSLEAWWPLDGDTVDYSGNGNSGGSVGGISFDGILIQNYTVP
jgi:hypothetical protein